VHAVRATELTLLRRLRDYDVDGITAGSDWAGAVQDTTLMSGGALCAHTFATPAAQAPDQVARAPRTHARLNLPRSSTS
jgi:hypothetical protein